MYLKMNFYLRFQLPFCSPEYQELSGKSHTEIRRRFLNKLADETKEIGYLNPPWIR